MSKANRYRELEIRDKIILGLQNDEFIKTKIETINYKNKTKTYPISKLPLSDQKIESSIAISVCFMGQRTLTKLSNNVNLYKSKFWVFIFYQDPIKEEAIDKCYELACDIENTIKNIKQIDSVTCIDFHPIKPVEKIESKYTYILAIELEACPHTSY